MVVWSSYGIYDCTYKYVCMCVCIYLSIYLVLRLFLLQFCKKHLVVTVACFFNNEVKLDFLLLGGVLNLFAWKRVAWFAYVCRHVCRYVGMSIYMYEYIYVCIMYLCCICTRTLPLDFDRSMRSSSHPCLP